MAKRHRGLRWGLALALLAGAHAAEPPQSPACALLLNDEAILAVNGAPVVGDGGPAQNGYSDCAWSNTGGSAVISLLFWSPDYFSAAETARMRYDRIVAALKRRHLPVSNVPDMGEDALLLDEGSPGLAAYTLIVLDRGAVVQIADRGVTRSATLSVATAIVGRAATGSPAPPEPDVQPGQSSPRRPAANACALLAKSDLPAPGFTVQEGGTAVDGETACNWQQAKDNIDISLVVREHDPAGAPYADLPPTSSGAEADPLEGIGEKANLERSGQDPNASYTIALLAGGRLAILSTFRVGRTDALTLASTIAGRL